MKIPLVIQTHPGENAIAAIASMMSYYGRIITLAEMRESNITSRGGSTPEQVKQMAAEYGLDCEILSIGIDELKGQKFPIVVRWKKLYYCIVKKISGNKVYIADPAKGEYVVELKMFTKNYKGTAIIMKPNKEFKKGGKRASVYGLILGRLKGQRKEMLSLAFLNISAVGLNLLMVDATKNMLDYVSTSSNSNNILDDILSFKIGDTLSAYNILVISMAVILMFPHSSAAIRSLPGSKQRRGRSC